MLRRFCLLIMAIAALPCIGQGHVPESPNILLIMTDDQGYGDLGCHGNEKIDTPVLDRLASQSVRFDRFFVSPYCTPTRAALMTGRYPLRTGAAAVTRGLETVRPEEVTIAEVLRDAGYATGCFGKWHIGEHYPSHPNGQGFDEYFGMPQGHWDNYFDPKLDHNGQHVETHGFITDVITDYALRFIEQHRDRPFFCYVPYNAPHTPLQVPDRYFDKYAARGLDSRTAAIYGLVENADENIGRLLAKLDELGLNERTIVFFLSDNGAEGPEGSRYNAGMRGMKGTVHEGGMRVPLFARWPGRFEPGRVIHPDRRARRPSANNRRTLWSNKPQDVTAGRRESGAVADRSDRRSARPDALRPYGRLAKCAEFHGAGRPGPPHTGQDRSHTTLARGQ